MLTLEDVYEKFGMVAEMAQLVETELGTALLFFDIATSGLISPETLQVAEDDKAAALDIIARINRQTLGQLIKNNRRHTNVFDEIEPLLSDALDTRNRLSHHFYRQHNMRKFSEAGRAIMMADLESMHVTLTDAYKALMLLSGTDLDKIVADAEARQKAVDDEPKKDVDKVLHFPI